MRVGFQQADFDALAGLWARVYPERYHVTPALLRAKTTESPLFDWGASFMELRDGAPVAFTAVKRSAGRLYKGPDKDVAHLTGLAFDDPLVGIDLMAVTKQVLRERGIHGLRFGQDAGHFFPGCPSDCLALRDFLIVEGFEEGEEVVDLERDLASYEPPEGALDAVHAWSGGPLPACDPGKAVVAPISPEHAPLLKEFLMREFPGRWAYDTLRLLDREERHDGVFALFIDGAIEGFALTQAEGQKIPIGGAVWHLNLGEKWGSLGPIGVSHRVRGQGYGGALLGATLCVLRDRGVRRCIIDWTTLVEFYGKHGFEPTRTYRVFNLALDAPA